MNYEKIKISILELNNSNDIYMTLDVLILTSRTNLNGARFLPEFINEIVDNKDFYIGLPLVCEKDKLEKGKYKNLGHGLKKDGTFTTAQIGSYVDFYKREEDDGEFSLLGKVKIFKRFKKVCNAVLELFNDGNLFFSAEAFVTEYAKNENGAREIGANEGNKLFGDCIVSFPAEIESKAHTIIAEALNQDLGGVNVKRFETLEDFFENTRIHIENSELDFSQVQKKLFNKIKEKLGDSYWDYYATDMGIDFVILQKYDDGDYYKCQYTVVNDDVEISDLVKVAKNYIPIESNNKGDDKMTLAEVTAKLEIAELKIKDLEKTVSEKDELIAEKDKAISEKENVLSESEVKMKELSENVTKLSESVVLKDNEIAELNKAKEELDKINLEKAEAEKVQKRVELKEKYSKLLDKTILSSTEVVEAIENLNEVLLQEKVVESALSKVNDNTQKDTVVNSRMSDDMSMQSNDLVSQYITINN